ncbi:CDC42 small effector protein 2-like isoform X1 [Mytilus galloprovincialis]|uniref:CDC42 small effector protein 2-like isoform X1 n=1 Tax=Mytilus galloprovincialis TaxID=29158 RepID=UPI003F7BDFE7
MMGDGLFCFTCCIAEQPQPKRRRRLDPSMIGEPTEFRHTAHIGSGEARNSLNADGTRNTETISLTTVQNQMSSKGGYDHTCPHDVKLNVIDLPQSQR